MSISLLVYLYNNKKLKFKEYFINNLIYRSRRFENSSKIIYTIKYYLSNNINNREIYRIAIKAISKTIAILNRKIFSDEKDDETIDEINLKK